MSEVKLVAISKPTIEGLNTAEEFIAYTARVSNPSNQMNTETAPKLVKYLLKNAHFSPLEMVHMTVEVETTRDIARQILRHRSFSFQEFSQRYADPTQSLGFVLREARLQDKSNRQNSISIDDAELSNEWDVQQNAVTNAALEAYNWAIGHGIAKEQARSVLPEGLTISRLYMSGTLRSFVHYCQLRRGNGTQREHMVVAEQLWSLIAKEFPATVAAIEEIELEKIAAIAETTAPR